MKGLKKKEAGIQELAKQSQLFGSRVFGPRQIAQNLPKKVASNWIAAMNGKERMEREHLELCADALKEWALRHGATHYTHWFQPLTGCAAEKHDAFLSLKGTGAIEHLRGKELLQGEPDASSFPSGGLRYTSAARGYTLWDPSTPAFLWQSNEGLTLYIPSLFFSWKGEPLDYKIPLQRSEQRLQQAVMRLLHLAQNPAQGCFSTLGAEQEYFLVDRSLFFAREDLSLAGRTVYGAKPPKGQELEDHYFSPLNEKVLGFMREFEEAALVLGIPLKTRHNEVAPAQHEVAPLFEPTSIAADHNLMLMQLMRQLASHHDLVCLFHEKPFAGINGSGKHCNWSVSTDTGQNLLDPKEDSFVFFTLLAAVLRGVHTHSALLRASIATAANDWRLGGAEAPPTILSVYLGEALEGIIRRIIHGDKDVRKTRYEIDLGLSHVLPHSPDLSDRNRTSFFAFTGNKFEFRAVGASQHVSWPVMIINAIVTESLHLILDELEGLLAQRSGADLLTSSLPVLRKHFKAAEPVLFSGNNYAAEWEEEAKKRGLPNIRKSYHSYAVLLESKTERAFEGILTSAELHSRHEIALEQYAKQMKIECNIMIDMFRTQILPAALKYQKIWARSLALVKELNMATELQERDLRHFSGHIEQAIAALDELAKVKIEIEGLGWEALAKVFCELALPHMENARKAVDALELWVDNELWPMPKYRELLYLQ